MTTARDVSRIAVAETYQVVRPNARISLTTMSCIRQNVSATALTNSGC